MKYLILFLATAALTTQGTLASAGAPKRTASLVAAGRNLFMTNCMVCHGEKGRGDGPAGATMSPRPRNFVSDNFKNGSKPENIFQTISQGLPGTAMASFSSLPEPDRWALAYYISSLRTSDGTKEK